jgi:type I restriction enzyme S subunit
MPQTMPLRRLAEVRVSNVDKKSVEGEKSVRLCNYTDVYYNDSIRTDAEYLEATATRAQVERFRLRVGDTVITKDSETADDIAVAAYVTECADDLVCGYHLALLRPRTERIEPRFLAWAIRSDYCKEQFSVAATGVTRFGLKYESILRVSVPTPDLGEQRRVADFLDEQSSRIDEAVRLRREQVKALEERFRALVASHVDAAGFDRVPLRRVLDRIQTGSTPVADPVEDEVPESVGWYTPDSFGAFGTLGEPRRQYRPDTHLVIFPGDSVLFVGIGWASGRVAYLARPGAGNQQLTALTPRSDKMIGRFLMWQMFHLGESLRRNAPYTVIPVLSNDYLKSALVRLPSVQIQSNVVQVLDGAAVDLMETQSQMLAQIDLLQERKRSLITAAVTGEFDVTVARGRGM